MIAFYIGYRWKNGLMITLSITDSHNPNLEMLSHLKRFQLFEFNSFQHFSHLQTTFFPLLEAVTLGMGNILPWKDEYDISINTATFYFEFYYKFRC